MVEPTESEPLAGARPLLRRDDRDPRRDRARSRSGAWPRDDNPLKNAPHTAEALLKADWPHPYTREEAAFPVPALRRQKYWSPVGRVDNVYGDRNLFCSCPPLADYESRDRAPRGRKERPRMAVSRLRPLQDRHRPEQLHTVGPMRAARLFVHRLDARGPARRAPRASQPSSTARSAPPARATAATRRCCSAWPGTSPTRSTSRRIPALLAAIRGSGRLACSARTTIALRREGRPDLPPPRDACPSTPTACASPRSTPTARELAEPHLLLGRRRLRRQRRGRGRRQQAEGDRARHDAAAASLPQRRRTAAR